ncbi:MAG: hypothetical protein C4309_00380 [Chloroflexota bacterium]
MTLLEIRHMEEDTAHWVKRAYEAIYTGPGIRQLESFYLWLLDILSPLPGRRLLDVSCGEGTLVRWASARGVEAYGIDLAEAAVRIAYNRGGLMTGKSSFAVAAGEHLPFPDVSFDYVTNIGSLEHFADVAAGVREMARILRPNGTALMLVPNLFSLLHNVYEVWRKGHVVDDGQPLQRYATRRDWEQLLRANGLTVLRTVKYEREWPRSRSDLAWYLRHPKALVRLMLSPVVPLNLASCFVFLCCRDSTGDGEGGV